MNEPTNGRDEFPIETTEGQWINAVRNSLVTAVRVVSGP